MVSCIVLVAAIAGHTATAAAETTKVLRIGYQKSSTFLLARLGGELESTFKARGVSVEWREFTSGPPILQALSAGALDVGEVGDAPVVFAQAGEAPLKYLAYADSSPDNIGIIVKAGSPIKSVTDLSGARIGFAEGSSAHFLVVRALRSAGLRYGDIKPVFLQPPEGRVGFDSGAVDAWAIWDPFLAAAELGSRARIVARGAGLSPYFGFYVAADKFLRDAPELISPLLAELELLRGRAKKDVDKTAATISSQLGIPPDVAIRYERRKQRYGAKPLSDVVIASQQALADEFLAQRLIKRPIVVRDYVWQPRPTVQQAAQRP